MISGRVLRKGGYMPNLSATFKNARALGFNYASSIATLDEALDGIDRTQREKDARARRNEGVPKQGPTREQLFRVAKALSFSPHSKAKVKMPTFSIQKDNEIGDA